MWIQFKILNKNNKIIFIASYIILNRFFISVVSIMKIQIKLNLKNLAKFL